MIGTSKQHEKSLFRPFLDLFLFLFKNCLLIFNGIHSDYGIQMQNLVFGSPRKNVQISLFKGGGRGSRRIQKFPNYFFPYLGGEGGGLSKLGRFLV